MVGRQAGLLKRVIGTAVQFGVTSFIAKKGADNDPNSFNKKGIFKRIFSRPKS